MKENKIIIIIGIIIAFALLIGVATADELETIQITDTTFEEQHPSIIFADNHFYIAYQSNEKGNNDIFIKKYDLNWNFIEEKQITTNPAGQNAPSIAFENNTKTLYVAYDSAETGNYDVFIRVYDSALNPIGEKRQMTKEKTAQRSPSIAFANKYLYIAYTSNERGNYDIFIEKYDLNWNQIEKEQMTVGGGWDPSIALTENNLFIAYLTSPGPFADLNIEKYDLNNLAYIGTVQELFESPALAVDVISKDNNIYVSFDFSTVRGALLEVYDVFIVQYGSNLNRIGRRIVIYSLYEEVHPSLTFANESLYVAYTSYETGNGDIYTKKFVEMTFFLSPLSIALIIVSFLVFLGTLIYIYKKRDGFMISKIYRYIALVIIIATTIIWLAYSSTYPDLSDFNFVLMLLPALYIPLVGTISRSAKESFIFGSFAFLCFCLGSLLSNWLAYVNPYAFKDWISIFFIFYLPFILSSVATQPLMSWLKKKVSIKITKPIPNPYIAGVPIREKEMFFGRKDVFKFLKQRFITETAKTNIFLYGGRRIGKTSALYQIKGGALGDEFIPVFIDLQSIGDMNTYGFFDFVTQEIRKTLLGKGIKMKEYAFDNAKESYTATFNQVLDDVSDLINDKQLILMFDETEILEKMIRKGKFDSAIYSFFESIIQHKPNVSCIFTGSPGALSKREEGTPLFRAANYQKVTFLETEDATELVKRPAEGFAQYSDKVIERILRITGCHPFYIQYICYEIVNILNKEKRNNVKMKDIDSVINKLVKGAPMHLGYVWDKASYDEKIVLSLLSEIIGKEDEFISAPGIEKYKNEKEKKGETTIKLSERIEKILEDLYREDILEKDSKNRYRYKVDLIRYWVKGYYSVWRVIGEEEHESVSE